MDYDRHDRRRRSPSPTDHIMDFREYSHSQKDKNKPLDMDQLLVKYALYKQNCLKAYNEKYFKLYMIHEWFKEKFHPAHSQELLDHVRQNKAFALEGFLEELKDGKFDSVSFDESAASRAEPAPEGEANEVYPNLEPPSRFTVFIKSIPDNLPRKKMLEVFSTFPGFKSLELTDPRPEKRNTRLGWIVFENELDQADLTKLESIEVDKIFLNCCVQKKYPVNARIQSMYASQKERILADSVQVVQLAEYLDKEVGLDGVAGVKSRFESVIKPLVEEELAANAGDVQNDRTNGTKEAETQDQAEDQDPSIINEETPSNLQKDTTETMKVDEVDAELKLATRKLDLFVLYLNHVHFYDYYSGIESSSTQDHLRKGGLPVRRPLLEPNATKQSQHDKKQDDRNRIRQNALSPNERIQMGFKDIELQTDLTVSLYVRKEGEGKFRCTECQKLFRGDEFVRKHIRGKHETLIEHVEEEVKFYNNWCAEQSRIEKPIKPKEQRGGYAERERFERERYEKDRYGERERYDRYGERERFDRDRRTGRYSEGRRDARAVRSYHDLDAPAAGDIQISYD